MKLSDVEAPSIIRHPHEPSGSSGRRSSGEAFYGVYLPNVFINGQDMTLSQATAVAGPIPRPNDPLTPDTDITHVYVDTSSGHSQIRVVYSSRSTSVDSLFPGGIGDRGEHEAPAP